ncbi:MATE family efflux transporter [Zeaxanthinibacter enoshimensis]|uniref:O-antigen/teichoic acid export membrane protein n=1 Tax=Zeaxanthinibacter enoshimensis TaxID=392009 RepID=A0A4R6TN97_9FLAO|nr:sugar isomerase [Zeaxanthinibacter enoshimensis]TDQ31085.1 O-antigen/teichoic acid export membrane protein [Zeaxanthinibacter enoshimensis]
MTTHKLTLSPEQLFMGSILLVNGGNYLYNLILGRLLTPAVFAEAALLITLLLILSFMGMTFQLAMAKFTVIFSGSTWKAFHRYIYKAGLFTGVGIGLLVVALAPALQQLFNTSNFWMFTAFGFGVPLYFLMSIKRGKDHGKQHYSRLSLSYQAEMWSRLLLTLAALLLLPAKPGLLVGMGIAASFLFGLVPGGINLNVFKIKERLKPTAHSHVSRFILITASYEFTQIIINNSDILLVKHFFENTDAGLYASLALIGRVVYFVAWMFVMLLLPAVLERQKRGENTNPLLYKYVMYIGMFASTIILGCYLFPEVIIQLMFGKAYLPMAGLLWQYALATSLFAISNIFAYYFLCLDDYIPVMWSGIFGISQVLLIILFHSSLDMVVQLQIVVMTFLLISQLIYFAYKNIMR